MSLRQLVAVFINVFLVMEAVASVIRPTPPKSGMEVFRTHVLPKNGNRNWKGQWKLTKNQRPTLLSRAKTVLSNRYGREATLHGFLDVLNLLIHWDLEKQIPDIVVLNTASNTLRSFLKVSISVSKRDNGPLLAVDKKLINHGCRAVRQIGNLAISQRKGHGYVTQPEIYQLLMEIADVVNLATDTTGYYVSGTTLPLGVRQTLNRLAILIVLRINSGKVELSDVMLFIHQWIHQRLSETLDDIPLTDDFFDDQSEADRDTEGETVGDVDQRGDFHTPERGLPEMFSEDFDIDDDHSLASLFN